MNLAISSAAGVGAQANAAAVTGADFSIQISHLYRLECWRPVTMLPVKIARALGLSEALQAGIESLIPKRLAWSDECRNIIVNTGLDDYLDKYYKGSTYTASHFVGLTDDSPTIAAGDTMASHVGWVEATGYSEATREALTMGTVASQSVDNSASKASFSINATDTIGGAFITTNSTKSGTTGTLVGAAALTGGNQAVSSGDTLNVTVTCTMAAA